MRTSLSRGPRAWQGLTLSLTEEADDRPLRDTACEVATEVYKLGGGVPVAVLLAALELAGYDDPHALVLQAVTDAPHAFAWARL